MVPRNVLNLTMSIENRVEVEVLTAMAFFNLPSPNAHVLGDSSNHLNVEAQVGFHVLKVMRWVSGRVSNCGARVTLYDN